MASSIDLIGWYRDLRIEKAIAAITTRKPATKAAIRFRIHLSCPFTRLAFVHVPI